MIKRVVCVLALLVGSVAYGQEDISSLQVTSSSTNIGEQPVVTVVSTTGSVVTASTTDEELATTTPPAEGDVQESSTSTLALTEIEHGAFSTSSTSTVSTSSEAIGVVETQRSDKEEDKLFDVVYAGFEQFIEKFFGWQ